MVAFLQMQAHGLRVTGAPCRQPPTPLRVLRTGARSAGVVLRQSVLPGTQEAPKAVDALFDLFEFAFSPARLAAVFGLIALGFLWDFATALDNRTLLGQKRQTSVSILGQTYRVDAPSRFAITFSATVDGFYKSPSGGAERVKLALHTWRSLTISSRVLPWAKPYSADSSRTRWSFRHLRSGPAGNSRLARPLCAACVNTMRRTPHGSLVLLVHPYSGTSGLIPQTVLSKPQRRWLVRHGIRRCFGQCRAKP